MGWSWLVGVWFSAWVVVWESDWALACEVVVVVVIMLAMMMMSGSPNILAEIMARKRAEVVLRKEAIPLEAIKGRAGESDPPRNFFRAVTERKTMAVIAEIKRKSPSAGWIRAEYEDDGVFDPTVIARAYHEAGAAAISCLTDEHYFGGNLDYIRQIRNRVPLPVLRKDFIVDVYQLYEARAAGADAVLLIADALTEGQLVDFLILATELKMTTLVEVHEMDSLLKVRPHIGFPHPGYMLLGINNRDLKTMTTDLSHTLRLVDLVDDRTILVSESGIRTPADLKRLQAQEVNAVLVGEGLMREADPGAALGVLLG